MTVEQIKSIVISLVDEYSIRKVVLFGSRASETDTPESDIDLIVEFDVPVTILTLSGLKNRLEELTNLGVDVIHGPVREDDMIEIGRTVELYAA